MAPQKVEIIVVNHDECAQKIDKDESGNFVLDQTTQIFIYLKRAVFLKILLKKSHFGIGLIVNR
jgi:hypothetical protein